ncbi:MAG: hypothetical protein KBI07_06995 [Candidatus Atribacteria bacterium]|nr:hypothetical protein [Candidatus Atribacteria bacterium]
MKRFICLILILMVMGFVELMTSKFPAIAHQSCSISIEDSFISSKINPHQDLTINYKVTCSTGCWIRANIYFTSTGDPYTQYNPSNHCTWTYQPAGTHSYSVSYPSAGLLRAQSIEGSTAHFYVDVDMYTIDDRISKTFYSSIQQICWIEFAKKNPSNLAP